MTRRRLRRNKLTPTKQPLSARRTVLQRIGQRIKRSFTLPHVYGNSIVGARTRVLLQRGDTILNRDKRLIRRSRRSTDKHRNLDRIDKRNNRHRDQSRQTNRRRRNNGRDQGTLQIHTNANGDRNSQDHCRRDRRRSASSNRATISLTRFNIVLPRHVNAILSNLHAFLTTTGSSSFIRTTRIVRRRVIRFSNDTASNETGIACTNNGRSQRGSTSGRINDGRHRHCP